MIEQEYAVFLADNERYLMYMTLQSYVGISRSTAARNQSLESDRKKSLYLSHRKQSITRMQMCTIDSWRHSSRKCLSSAEINTGREIEKERYARVYVQTDVTFAAALGADRPFDCSTLTAQERIYRSPVKSAFIFVYPALEGIYCNQRARESVMTKLQNVFRRFAIGVVLEIRLLNR